MAGIYLLARWLLGIVLVFGPIAIALSLHHQTAPIFSRWFGKVVALICLEAAGVIVLVMIFAIDKNFHGDDCALYRRRQFPASDRPGRAPMVRRVPHAVSDLMNLVGMVIWFALGAFGLFALPSIAYSIGTVSPSAARRSPWRLCRQLQRWLPQSMLTACPASTGAEDQAVRCRWNWPGTKSKARSLAVTSLFHPLPHPP